MSAPPEASAPTVAALRAQATRWLLRDPDARTRACVAAWLAADDHAALAAAFGDRLAFGTAGLRAKVGPGPGAMNALVVRETMLGVLNVLAQALPQRRPIAIGFDGRLDSRRFAKEAIGVALAAGWPVEAFSRPVPTPLVGFWVKRRALAAGLVVTASHNPKRDNGIKVYWQGGVQIAPPIDASVAAAIVAVAGDELPVPWRDPSGQKATTDVTEAAIAAYAAALAALPGPWQRPQRPLVALHMAYSPLHGVGLELTRTALVDLPGLHLHVVPAQAEPDGNFPTIGSPNPEDPASLAQTLALGEQIGADLACVHDPDADRLAVAARWWPGAAQPAAKAGLPGTPAQPAPDAGDTGDAVNAGDAVDTGDAVHAESVDAPAKPAPRAHGGAALCVLSGDELGVALAHLLLQAKAAPDQVSVACSLVSSRLLPLLAKVHGAHCEVTLPGFKWLARAAMAAEAAGRPCVLAYEEALGYAPTSLVWDKDGVATLRLLALLAAQLAAQQQTLWDALALAQALTALSATGQQVIAMPPTAAKQMLARLRQASPGKVAGQCLVATDDGLLPDPRGPLAHLPPSNWLAQYYAPEGCPHADRSASPRQSGVRIMFRASGTEPKLKVYYEWLAAPVSQTAWPQARKALTAALSDFMHQHMASLQSAAKA